MKTIFKKKVRNEINQIRVDINQDPKETEDNVIIYLSKDGKKNQSWMTLSWDQAEQLADMFIEAIEKRPDCELKEVKDDK